MFVSIGNSRMDKKFNCTDMTYEDFVSRLSKTKHTAETMEQYRKMPKGQQNNIKDVGGFVLGKLKGGRRKKDCVISRSAITLDMDYGTQGIIDELEMFFDMKMVVYSTHKHTPEKPRLRIIIFLTRDVTPDEYGAVSRMLASDIGIELFDDSTYEPSRLMYWPSTSSDGEYVFQEIDGAEVDPDEVLARYKDWQNKLALDRRGNIKDTLQNIALIIRNDENFKNIVYNEFKDTIDVIGPLPWKQVKPGWNDSDLANAKVYFERVYGIWSPTKFKDALLAVVSSDRLYHPIKDYFATLNWDGQERIDTLLIDYFGAEDTPYTRAVIRKTLVAAVARIYKPGVKFDSILVLNGPQGMGKSTFFSILGKQWFSDSLSISDMRDKTAAEKLLGNWILEISEMNGIRKTEVEVVKSFVTRQDDKFRQAYGVNVESHPRKCIIVGSTNSEGGFLRDVTGNRRFWPVHVPGTGKHHPWQLDCVDQIWAEAIHLYNEGEELFLKGAEAEEAYKMQQEAMESDDREGIVQDYLDRLLPDNWASMDIYQRRAFLGGGEFETVGVKGTVVRERVCIMEIWVECFGKERQNLKKADSYEIEGILNKIGGWKKYDSNTTGKTKVPLYGVQKTFVRMDEKSQETR